MQFSLYDTLQTHIKDFASQLHTGMPAIVETYNPEENTVDVYPAIYRVDVDGVTSKYGLLQRVPVQRVGTSKISITYPLEKGDKVWLIFGESDTENWFDTDKEFVKPKTHRQHDLNDCIAIPTVTKYSNSPVKSGTEKDLVIYYNDSEVTIKEDGTVQASTSGENNVTLNPDGTVDINVKETFSVTNGTGELVDWLSQLTQLVSEITTNTVYGISPVNNKVQIESLKAQIDSMKK